ncbi:MAG: YagK/YfjJ domain-containing protein [Pseudomonadota bacterium]
MISCKSNRKGIAFPLVEYRRKANRFIHKQWAKTGFNPIGRSMAMLQIEAFVDMVSRAHEPAFIIRHDSDRIHGVHMTNTGRGLIDVLPLLGLFDSDHDYSEKPYAFLDACWMTENVTGIDLSLVWMSPRALTLNYANELNWLVDKLRMSCRQDWFLRAASDRRYESGVRAKRIQTYLGSLLYTHSRLLFVRVDFGYPIIMRSMLTIDRVYEDLRQFLSLKDWHALFDHLVGYVWVVEEGGRKGPHIHLLLVYSGAQVRKDVALGGMICDLWEQRITCGVGVSRNCNAFKNQYVEIGIGMIERMDRAACERAVYYATYFAKDPHRLEEDDPQYLRMKPAGLDSFGTGEAILNENNVGRPPTNPIPWVPDDMLGIRWPDRGQ